MYVHRLSSQHRHRLVACRYLKAKAKFTKVSVHCDDIVIWAIGLTDCLTLYRPSIDKWAAVQPNRLVPTKAMSNCMRAAEKRELGENMYEVDCLSSVAEHITVERNGCR
jgi:hypothetical protein